MAMTVYDAILEASKREQKMRKLSNVYAGILTGIAILLIFHIAKLGWVNHGERFDPVMGFAMGTCISLFGSLVVIEIKDLFWKVVVPIVIVMVGVGATYFIVSGINIDEDQYIEVNGVAIFAREVDVALTDKVTWRKLYLRPPRQILVVDTSSGTKIRVYARLPTKIHQNETGLALANRMGDSEIKRSVVENFQRSLSSIVSQVDPREYLANNSVEGVGAFSSTWSNADWLQYLTGGEMQKQVLVGAETTVNIYAVETVVK